MLVKNAENRGQLEFVSLEEMVPQDHLLRKIEEAIDFKKIYEFVEDLYCEDNGRPSIDPVGAVQNRTDPAYLRDPVASADAGRSEHESAYRWFIGYPLNKAVPHFSTVSYNFKHRFNHATVEYIFRWILKAAAEEGYLDTEAIFVDGTHIKASANLKKQAKKSVPKQAKRMQKSCLKRSIETGKRMRRSRFRTTARKRRRKRRKRSCRLQTRRAEFSTRGNTKNALPTRRIRLVTSTISCSAFKSPGECP